MGNFLGAIAQMLKGNAEEERKRAEEEERKRIEAEEKAAAEKAAAKARAAMFGPLGKVPVKYGDGTVEMVYNYCYIEGDECLISAGGGSYHSHVGCITHWPKEYQDAFDGWEIITIEEAKARGLSICKRCEKKYNRAQDDTRSVVDVLDEIEEEERESAIAEREEERELYE